MRNDLPFIVYEFKVYVRNMSDIELHQEIAGQWNATRDFDEDQMNILIEELDRRTQVTTEVPCKTHPDAPHGFDRNASHSADRYVCECESWEPVDAVNISAERVDETAKSEHEPVCFLRETNWSYEIAPWDDPNGIPVYVAPPKKEWVGLTDEEIYDYADKFLYSHGNNYGIKSFGKAIEAKLKEKNGD